MHLCIRYTMKRMRRNISTYAFPARRRAVLIGAILVSSCGLLQAQVAGGSPLAPLPSAEAVITRNTNNFSGSIPQGKATGETMELTAVSYTHLTLPTKRI